MDYRIKFRPIKPGTPHVNGKAERSQPTDKQAFYALVDLASSELAEQLACWPHKYNGHRPPGALNGKTPMETVIALSAVTPVWEDVGVAYAPSKDCQLRTLQR